MLKDVLTSHIAIKRSQREHGDAGSCMNIESIERIDKKTYNENYVPSPTPAHISITSSFLKKKLIQIFIIMQLDPLPFISFISSQQFQF